MCKKKFDWVYLEPFVFFGIIALDCNGVITDQQSVLMYTAFFLWLLVKYLLLMSAIVDSICTFMGIPFIRNKPVARKQGKRD